MLDKFNVGSHPICSPDNRLAVQIDYLVSLFTLLINDVLLTTAYTLDDKLVVKLEEDTLGNYFDDLIYITSNKLSPQYLEAFEITKNRFQVFNWDIEFIYKGEKSLGRPLIDIIIKKQIRSDKNM